MRHFATRLATSFRFFWMRNRNANALRARAALTATYVALTLVPVAIVGGMRMFGAHVGIALYVQIWLLPLVIGAVRWGVPAALGVSVIGLAALDPGVTRLVLGPGPSLSVTDWVAQAGLFGVFALSVGVLARRHLVVERARPTFHGLPATDMSGGLADSDRVLASLANTVEIRDHHTQGHCRRVARNAVVVGRALGLSRGALRILHWAATLHDLGKIAVPEYILLKTGRLSEEEFAEIRRHPMYGADLLASVSQSYRAIADVVRAHHERWDGLGYPLGLKRDEIPEMARIIAIVDVFEALTSERPYRSPMPELQALQYVKNGAGTQFDPRLVDVFAGLYLGGEIECAASTLTSSRRQVPTHDALLQPNV